jgi:maltooligosyltrehalose trehalohydrolase
VNDRPPVPGTFGAQPIEGGTAFRVWAPGAGRVTLAIDTGAAAGEHALARDEDGFAEAFVPGARAGDRYRYRLDERAPLPDPASRFQPEGVHGPSEIVDPLAYRWSDAAWRGVAHDGLVIYELHVGTFTGEGTFAAAAARLPYLRDLGVTAIELMPVADFAGARNWGYDGVCLFAPSRAYGRPDNLRRLVDAAHALGLGVLLDVVYNHLGPEGAYLPSFSPAFFSARHSSPWGDGVNLDGPGSAHVRAFLIENARHWIREYRMDGLRLDATHALQDEGPRHFLAELAATLHAVPDGPAPLVIAEDHRNLACMVQEAARGGWSLDGVWADDFHHQMRRLLAGDGEGYYSDYSGAVPDLAATIRDGWFYRGQHSEHFGHPRGTDPSGIPPRRLIVFLQNHDQIGNRALGDRLQAEADLASCRAATAVLLASPATPLLFMGQEWAASTPFLFFTDHPPELGRLVTEGRRREFAQFAAFAGASERIPDPQAVETFVASRLRWDERDRGAHAATLRLHRALLALRREDPALRNAARSAYDAQALDDDTLALCRRAPDGSALWIVARLRGSGGVALDRVAGAHGAWSLVLSTEDAAFACDPAPPSVDLSSGAPRVVFRRPSAVILRHA